jgi:predicted RNA-binding Zn ribbon-like protein
MSDEPVPIAAPRDDLCLDFANTLSWRGTAAPSEALAGPDDLLGWLARSAALPPRLIRQARERMRDQPDAAERMLAAALVLREAIYRVFAAAAAGALASDDDLARINEALAAAPPRSRLLRSARIYAWGAEPDGISLPCLLAPVLWSAGDLLTRIDRYRVRQCANDQCLWLFIDQSKGGTRRWCDMSSCGNRAKARRHYIRSKPGAGVRLPAAR